MSATALSCPHCKRPARIRSSRPYTQSYRHLNVECTNRSCGHTFVVAAVTEFQVLYSVHPSATPDPAVDLPFAPPRARRAAANDNAHNDNDRGPGVPLSHAVNHDTAPE